MALNINSKTLMLGRAGSHLRVSFSLQEMEVKAIRNQSPSTLTHPSQVWRRSASRSKSRYLVRMSSQSASSSARQARAHTSERMKNMIAFLHFGDGYPGHQKTDEECLESVKHIPFSDLNLVTETSGALLNVAAQHNRATVVEYLLSVESRFHQISARSFMGRTALHDAILRRDEWFNRLTQSMSMSPLLADSPLLAKHYFELSLKLTRKLGSRFMVKEMERELLDLSQLPSLPCPLRVRTCGNITCLCHAA